LATPKAASFAQLGLDSSYLASQAGRWLTRAKAITIFRNYVVSVCLVTCNDLYWPKFFCMGKTMHKIQIKLNVSQEEKDILTEAASRSKRSLSNFIYSEYLVEPLAKLKKEDPNESGKQEQE